MNKEQIFMILQMVPTIISLIKSIEDLFPEGGNGKAKLELVKGILTTTYEGIASAWPVIEILITKIVSFANAIGAFRKPIA